MKKKNVVDAIAMKMMSEENGVFDFSDSVILQDISISGDINQKGRDGRTFLLHAIAYKRYQIAKKLLQLNADIGIKDELGNSALHVAVMVKDKKMVKLLLENHADVNAVNNYGNSPLLQSSHNDIDIISLLVSYGADPSLKNKSGISAYDAFSAYPEIIRSFKIS